MIYHINERIALKHGFCGVRTGTIVDVITTTPGRRVYRVMLDDGAGIFYFQAYDIAEVLE